MKMVSAAFGFSSTAQLSTGDKMTDNRISWGDTPEQNLMVVKTLLEQIHYDLYNGGKDGLITQFKAFVTDFNATRREQERNVKARHLENSEKLAEISAEINHKNADDANAISRKGLMWTIIGVLLSVLLVIGCVVGIIISIKLANNEPIRLHSHAPVVTDASMLSVVPRSE